MVIVIRISSLIIGAFSIITGVILSNETALNGLGTSFNWVTFIGFLVSVAIFELFFFGLAQLIENSQNTTAKLEELNKNIGHTNEYLLNVCRLLSKEE